MRFKLLDDFLYLLGEMLYVHLYISYAGLNRVY